MDPRPNPQRRRIVEEEIIRRTYREAEDGDDADLDDDLDEEAEDDTDDDEAAIPSAVTA